jgi:hypothetical protein
MDYCIKCSQPLFHGTIPHRCIADIPCPSCAALRARIEDVEGMAFVIAEDYCPVGMPTIVSPVDIKVARAVSAWLKEG